ncbi:tripartite tricarboxylate transporter TctB family protein [Caldovatus aquaticus]|uniref:Tripartite tricarboxylate transporter TctB family protein n=1 Tax=Caldovatus aquaticus TaxID=2865671 RepID=A0ABS7F4L4_9PROT|nr:tripartite tricarboxylate transporter TctB family protein [Caldovatus aquaticus]MBW8270560.1 tripartite tricarboxylate transporter TctB family protein [Caldovatus aquaticus]
MRINAKDLFSGLILIVIALVGLWLNADHAMGTAQRMGPGYMPWLTFMLQLVLGAIIVVLALNSGPDPLERWAWREMSLVLLGMCVFGLLLERGGLFLSTTAMIVIASLADRTHRPLGVLGVTIFLLALCWWVFIHELDIRVSVWPQF